MRKITVTILTMVLAGLMGMGNLAAAAQYGAAPEKKVEVIKAGDLKGALRDLWLGHIFWVRNVALATRYGNTEAAKVAEENAVQNAKAIAGAIGPFYGQAASDKLFGLLAGHYGAVKEYMTAAYAGDKGGKDKAAGALTKNADEIALFLSGANPYLPKATLVSLLTAHGGHHLAQIDALAAKDYGAEAQVWEPMKNHIYVIADALCGGLAKQFPDKVSK
jgi:hypothetical protein